MNRKKSGAFSRKCKTFLTAAVISTMLAAGQGGVMSAYASTATDSLGALIPDSLTVSSPRALSEISLPSNEYGKLVWEDSSRTAEEGEHSFTVLIKPASGVDLSGMSGWDAGEKAVVRSVTVLVSGGSEDTEEEEESAEEETFEEDTEESVDEDAEDADDEDAEDADDEDAEDADGEDAEDADDEDADDADDVHDAVAVHAGICQNDGHEQGHVRRFQVRR